MPFQHRVQYHFNGKTRTGLHRESLMGGKASEPAATNKDDHVTSTAAGALFSSNAPVDKSTPAVPDVSYTREELAWIAQYLKNIGYGKIIETTGTKRAYGGEEEKLDVAPKLNKETFVKSTVGIKENVKTKPNFASLSRGRKDYVFYTAVLMKAYEKFGSGTRGGWMKDEHYHIEMILRILRGFEDHPPKTAASDIYRAKKLWTACSRKLETFGVYRDPMACKIYWSRYGRELSGFDERRDAQGKAPPAGSLLFSQH